MEDEKEGVPIKDIQCPNCKTSLKGTLTEFTLVPREYSVEPGYRERKGYAGIGSPGNVRVQAVCYRCDYEWTLKKASQITDLDKEQSNNK